MNREKLIEQAKKLCLETSKKVLDKLEFEFETIMNEIDHLKKIDVSGVEPMARPFEQLTHYLREDVPGQTMPLDTLLKNASSKKDNMITMKKVLKND